ncbi:uncharacterized protein N0V89_000548 [Didymosphaeria variabile]|uniref:Uncharacterized protein n=1 Tax=Didymosphaeria variabile TaxID=1932322 RepID=A0A9W9CFT4_9PLEO|nr:uncharacterized protein N0V89_000548 [Didymosphaeria variabile]KAJ4359989.1 hypothetical protein N0V89_000548 [Didymosphaeria variabile]
MPPPVTQRPSCLKRHWTAAGSTQWTVLYSLILPICTLFMAGIVVYRHFSAFPMSLRMALYAGFCQMLDLLWYLYFNGSLIVDWYGPQKPANWKRPQKPLDDWNVCFVDRARGAQIRKQGWTRIGCLEARAVIVITCGFLGIHRAANATRVAQQTHAANVRLQQLRRESPVHGGSDHEHLEAAVSTPLPADAPVEDRENQSGCVGNQRWADEVHGRSDSEGWSCVAAAFEEPVNPFADPVRARDMV